MRTTGTAPEPESIGGVIKGLLEDISTLFRSEIALAKIEIRQSVAGFGGAGALFAVALVFALIGGAFVFVTLVLVLALWMPAWVAALIVAILLFALAGLAGWLGYRKLQNTELAPLGAIQGMKDDVEMIRSELHRVRERTDEQ
jgi:hypothetical protein